MQIHDGPVTCRATRGVLKRDEVLIDACRSALADFWGSLPLTIDLFLSRSFRAVGTPFFNLHCHILQRQFPHRLWGLA